MREDRIVNTLREVREVLNKYKVEFWLDSGALLGAIREGKLIPWDHDIDLGAWYKDLDKIIDACKELKSRGFVIDSLVCEKGEEAITVNVDRKREYPIVIELHKVKNDMLVRKNLQNPGFDKETRLRQLFRRGLKYVVWVLSRPSFVGDNPKYVPKMVHIALIKVVLLMPDKMVKFLDNILSKIIYKLGYIWVEERIPANFFRKFSTIEFYGMKFKVPCPVEKYLEFRYGKDWKIPKKNWSFSRDDGAFSYLRSEKAILKESGKDK